LHSALLPLAVLFNTVAVKNSSPGKEESVSADGLAEIKLHPPAIIAQRTHAILIRPQELEATIMTQ